MWKYAFQDPSVVVNRLSPPSGSDEPTFFVGVRRRPADWGTVTRRCKRSTAPNLGGAGVRLRLRARTGEGKARMESPLFGASKGLLRLVPHLMRHLEVRWTDLCLTTGSRFSALLLCFLALLLLLLLLLGFWKTASKMHSGRGNFTLASQ